MESKEGCKEEIRGCKEEEEMLDGGLRMEDLYLYAITLGKRKESEEERRKKKEERRKKTGSN